jgi:hypothetical protein
VIACIHGVQAAINLGIVNIILETNVVLVKQTISARDYTHSMVGSLLEELQCMVNANFNSFVCVSIPRDCNRVAHELATLRCVCGRS